MTSQTPEVLYRERLLPSLGFFFAWLLVIPAVWLIMLPINADIGIPVAIGAYVLAAGIFIVLSPKIVVRAGELLAGHATIPVNFIGSVEALGSEALRLAIGQEADARNYLVVRGWIHVGLKLEITDESDPTPYWIITSRKPLALADAISKAAAE